MSQQSTLPASAATRTSRLLACGIVAGPLFLAVGLTQAFIRDGFDLSRHPLSLLSLGDLGWVQIANFVVTGGLFLACAVGMGRALGPGRGGTWGPRLVGALGAGLVMAGVFVADAGAGFPPGAPAGAPEISWHGALHEAGFALASLGMVAGCLVFARRFAGLRQVGLGRGQRGHRGRGPGARRLARPGRRQRAPGGRLGGPVRLRGGAGRPPAAAPSRGAG